jgi:hypothetical protein
MGIGIKRGQRMDRRLHVDTLILIPTLKIYFFGSMDRLTEGQMDRDINPERAG